MVRDGKFSEFYLKENLRRFMRIQEKANKLATIQVMELGLFGRKGQYFHL